jgi:Delta7-sterol 5-desaturase
MSVISEAALRIFSVTAGRYIVIAGIPFIIFYLLLPGRMKRMKIQQRLASRKDILRELAHSAQSTVVFTIIGLLIFFTPVREYTQMYKNLSDAPLWVVPMSLIGGLIIHDTYFYWLHRLLHHPKLFRRTHLVHHKSTNPSPWASYSFHIIEAVVEGIVLLPVVMLLPMHTVTVALFVVVGFIINVYGHLGYEIMPKAFRRSWAFEVFNTSMHHNLHHSKFKGNYGLYFRFWDRIMGTEHPDYVKEYDQVQAQRFGLPRQQSATSHEPAKAAADAA